ncbi:hypothetical protein DQ04_00731070 [Trypanosoma grayi]|uniref:hypothetical protein n=1 Tax=Trypanosoma grayi TaxID=71804 RepID=UPI0004F43878|nr:hypothetical protein DQ04_00731070 [Trypanosoma grayi]KEG13885.1 hypothetical protein DQ04_00731070 [Trypanosoma grayi]
MLESFEDAYTDYLSSLLCHTDVDVNIVRETLRSVGIDEADINDMLGDGLHRCPSSATSDSSCCEGHTPSRHSVASPNEISVFSSNSERPDALLGHTHAPRGEVAQKQQQTRCVSPSVSAVSSSADGEPPAHKQGSPPLSPDAADSRGEGLQRSQERMWENFIVTPERRDRYRTHLRALERLLGVALHLVDSGGEDSLPLEIRSFLCRQRMEKWLLSGCRKKELLSPPPPPPPPSLPPPRRRPKERLDGARRIREEKELRGGHCTSRVKGCEVHPPRGRHHGSPQRHVTSSSSSGSRRQCELCASLEDRFLSARGAGRLHQPQITPVAVGNSCGVKMLPQVMNTVGCGRMSAKAVVTTLPHREDRVRKALAYRDEWSTIGVLEGHNNMPWRICHATKCGGVC